VKRALLLLAILLVPAGSQGAQSKGGETAALVTSETNNTVAVVDLSSGRVIRRLAMPAEPENVETARAGGLSAVVSAGAGAVTLVSLPGLRVRRIIRGFAEPHIAAFSPDSRYLYVTDDLRGELVVIGLRRARVVRRLFVGRGAHHIAVRPDGERLWIALGERAKEVVIVNTRRPTRPWVAGRLLGGDLGGLVHDVAFAPGGYRVWVTYDDRPTIAVFDARTYRRVLTLRAGSPPQHVAFGPHPFVSTGRFAYVTSGNDGRLRIFSLRGRLLGVAATPVGSFNLAVGDSLVLTSSLTRGTLTELKSTGGRIWTKRIAPAARDAAFADLP
jgi:DNA-binding beta-propeller fold protein YncE